MGRKQRTTFVLKSVDIDELFSTEVNKDDDEGYITRIDIYPERPVRRRDKHLIEFKDIHKKTLRYYPTMIDLTKGEALILPQYTTLRCHNCHYSFSSVVLGCPIAYKKQECDSYEKKIVETFFEKNNFTLDDDTDFFVTEWVFCSIPCVKGYILKQISIHNSAKYHHSLTLLTLMIQKMYKQNDYLFVPQTDIKKVLKDYGGHLSIDDLRMKNTSSSFIDTVNMRRPYLFPCSQYMEERKLR